MSDNQQQNRDQGNMGDDIPEGNPVKFKYKRSSPFPLLLRIAEHEMDTIEDFFDRAQEAWRKGQHDLEQIAVRFKGKNVPDDWLVDDVAQLKEFSWLYAEFAIIGLWRCIELYRKSAMRFALSRRAARRASEHEKFKVDLLRLNIKETKIHCARSVDELRCLNNAIKHERLVKGKLADFPRWKNKKGDKLGDLESHYLRLRPFAERYLKDLTERLKKAKGPSAVPAGQVSNT